MLLLLFIWGNHDLQAHTFASDLKVTFSGSFTSGPAVISFTLNDKADNVIVRIKRNNTVVHTINAGAKAVGPNSVNWDGSGNTGDGVYTFEIETSTTGYSAWTQIFDSGGIGIFTRGGDVVRNPLLPRFGHWLAGDIGGGDFFQGISEWLADGRPANPSQPVLLEPLLGPSVQPWHLTVDDDGYVYFSDIMNRKIYRFNPDFTNLHPIISGVKLPRGLHVRGTGADKTIYFAADTSVFRAKIGADDVFTGTPEKVLEAHIYVRDVLLDDSGALYVTLRTIDPADSLDGGLEGFVNSYDISGPLPAEGTFSLFSIPLGRPIGLAINRGANLASGADDSIYVSLRAAGTTNAGIFKLNIAQGTARRLVDYPNNANRRADLAVDPAGNIVWFENGEEHNYMYSPPGPSKYITPNPPGQEIKVGATAVESRDATNIPNAFVLYPAHPNPFSAHGTAGNPSTKIRFDLAQPGHALLRIFDISGREVAVIVNDRLSAGQHEYTWDGRNLPSGVYLYRLEALGYSAARRVMLVK
jgi:flagellar hook assembly protein FlgD/streptogramin lyase